MSELTYLQSCLSDFEHILASIQRSIRGSLLLHLEFLHSLKNAQQILINMDNYVRTQMATITRRMPPMLLLSIFQFLSDNQQTQLVCKVWYQVLELPIVWFGLYSKKGNALTQYNLGLRYNIGRGVQKDMKKAIRLYQLSAEQGNANAQNNLGICYKKGIGCVKNTKEAIRLYTLSVAQGNAPAQCNLGYCYEHGEGVIRDIKEAIRLYRLSGKQGNAVARYNLIRVLKKKKKKKEKK